MPAPIIHKQYYKYYCQLERIMAAIEHLKIYIHKANTKIQEHSFCHESDATLLQKTQLVAILNTVAHNEKRPLEDRLRELKAQIEQDASKIAINNYYQYPNFTWQWLCQCIILLFSTLKLIHPAREQCYKQLILSVDTPVIDTPHELARLSS
jgi:hypothetical protein